MADRVKKSSGKEEDTDYRQIGNDLVQWLSNSSRFWKIFDKTLHIIVLVNVAQAFSNTAPKRYKRILRFGIANQIFLYFLRLSMKLNHWMWHFSIFFSWYFDILEALDNLVYFSMVADTLFPKIDQTQQIFVIFYTFL